MLIAGSTPGDSPLGLPTHPISTTVSSLQDETRSILDGTIAGLREQADRAAKRTPLVSLPSHEPTLAPRQRIAAERKASRTIPVPAQNLARELDPDTVGEAGPPGAKAVAKIVALAPLPHKVPAINHGAFGPRTGEVPVVPAFPSPWSRSHEDARRTLSRASNRHEEADVLARQLLAQGGVVIDQGRIKCNLDIATEELWIEAGKGYEPIWMERLLTALDRLGVEPMFDEGAVEVHGSSVVRKYLAFIDGEGIQAAEGLVA